MKKLKFIIIILFSLNTINCFSRTDTIKCFSSWTTLDTITENLNIGDTLVFSNCGSPQLESLPAYTLSYASIPLYIIVGNEFLWYWSAYQAVKPEPNTFAYNYSIWQSNQHANISEYSMANISIFPNPATEVLKINSPQKVKAFVYDCLGDMIMEKQLPQGNSEIGTSTLAKGIYIVKLIDDRNNITNKKIVIE